jgi:predicted MPP superfamily phosphohydrolase
VLRIALILAVLAQAGAFVWGFLIEPALLRNEDYELTPTPWPAACDGLRVAVLADLHIGSTHNGLERVDRIIRLTRDARPDLILLAGDFVIHGVLGGTFASPEEIAEALRPMSAPLGVWAVLGNHDWWLDGPRVRRAFESVGVRFLENDSSRIERGGCAFWLSGIGDFWEGSPDIDAMLSKVTDDAPVLAFTHNPDIFPQVPPRVSLTIAGHTHGGQVYIPGIGRPKVPSRYGERYAIGHVVEEGRQLFVSTGVGTSILPVRFLVPPEMSLLVLRGSSAPTQP